MRVVAALVLFASPAFSQATTCHGTAPATVTCQSAQSGPDYSGFVQQFNQNMSESTRQTLRAMDAMTAAQLTKKVGQMVADGDCAGAERYALSKGDFALAERVKDYCAK